MVAFALTINHAKVKAWFTSMEAKEMHNYV